MLSVWLSLSTLRFRAAPLTAGSCNLCTACTFCLADPAGRDIQSCGYTHIPETHIHPIFCPIEPSKALPGSRTTVPYNLPCPPLPSPPLALPCLALPFPLRVCCAGRPKKGPHIPFAFGHAVRNEIHIKQNRSDRCNAGPRFAPCPGLPGVLDLSCLPPFRLLPGLPRCRMPSLPAAICTTLAFVWMRPGACLPSWERYPPLPIPASSSFPRDAAIIIGLSPGPTSRPELQDCFWSGACREAFVSGWDEFSVRQ